MLTINPTDILDNTENHDQLTWSFNSNGETFNYLADGETLVLTYTVKVEDDALTPLNDTENISITITGTNDAPVIATVSGDTNSATINETEGQLTTSGTLTVTDVDTTDSVTLSTSVVASGITDGLEFNSTGLKISCQ